jgi:hypothetical protein
MSTREAIYAAFDSAFSTVSAYLITHEGQQVGRVAFKHGASVRCFAQVWGSDMAQGKAGGGGYDKATAAAEQAFARMGQGETRPDVQHHVDAIKQAMTGPDGHRWISRIEAAGYSVQHVFG